MLWNGRGNWKLRANSAMRALMRGEPVDDLAVELHGAGFRSAACRRCN